MAELIALAVVGHTNAGKTSLLRTLTRRGDFGEVSSRPGTTRHVEAIDLKLDGATAVRLFDTPGLEDSIALHEHLRSLAGDTPVDRIRAFLRGPEARGVFEQEAKVLRQMLEVDAALYVIDCREPVLPKFRCEIEILASCAKPLMPVLNFVRDLRSREAEWQSVLTAHSLHAQVRFDAVAPFAGSESHLYEDLATLLRDRRTQLKAVVAYLDAERRERRAAGCRRAAELLVAAAALRHTLAKEELTDTARRAAFIGAFQRDVIARARRCVDDLLAIHGFRKDEADVSVLPWLDGRWEDDLFGPGALEAVGKQVGAGAAVGASIGLAADLALGGLSLGAATALGATVGGLASQGFGPMGRSLFNKARGRVELTLEDELLRVLAVQMVNLLTALERRGHAASAVAGKIVGAAGGLALAAAPDGDALTLAIARAVQAAQRARRHPQWASHGAGSGASAAQRAVVDAVAAAIGKAVAVDEL